MKPLPINFIEFTPRSAARIVLGQSAWLWLLVLLASAFFIGTVSAFFNINKALNEQRTESTHLQRALNRQNSAQQAIEPVSIAATQAAAINQIAAQLNLPWRDVLSAIEAATPASIALLALDPEAKTHSVIGTAEAKTADDMLAYIDALKQQPFFDLVLLTRHEINLADPNQPLRFQFSASWRVFAK